MTVPQQTIELLSDASRAQRDFVTAASRSTLQAFAKMGERNLALFNESAERFADAVKAVPQTAAPADSNAALSAATGLFQQFAAPLQHYVQDMTAIAHSLKEEMSIHVSALNSGLKEVQSRASDCNGGAGKAKG